MGALGVGAYAGIVSLCIFIPMYLFLILLASAEPVFGTL
jgi:hypothetical protein